jgi:hypothetical protein
LNATEKSIAETVDAMRDSDYRRANPGDYACPHCRYVSLKREASRCPLCRGEIGGDYWNAVRAREKAEVERKRAVEAAAAAEWIRTAPEREAAGRAAALATASAAEEKRQTDRLKSIAGLIIGAVGGAVAGVIAGFVIGIPVFIVGGLLMGDSTRGGALANTVAHVVMVLGAVLGAVLGWVRPWRD